MRKVIPFYKPYHDDDIENAVIASLRTGWLSCGPRVREFEHALQNYTGSHLVICTGSAGMSLQMVLRFFGISTGDEVILPAFTHPATANAVVLAGAKPVFADISLSDFTISGESIEQLISSRTKAIIPVDIAGLPCDYRMIYKIVEEKKHLFHANGLRQERLGRIAVIADASHSFGAMCCGKKSGMLADVSVFSFHAVKNLTTGEGAAICFNVPDEISEEEIRSYFEAGRSHGMTLDAYTKLQKRTWNYDVVEPFGKSVMTDPMAAMGLVMLRKYDSIILPVRRKLFSIYNRFLNDESDFVLPVMQTDDRESSCHLYIVRMKHADKDRRDAVMQTMYDEGVITNLHNIPVPLLEYYKSSGYTMAGIENTAAIHGQCISLPLYHELSEDDIGYVCETLIKAVQFNS